MTQPSQRTVLYVANSSLIGGANRVLTDLIDGLDRSRYRPILIVPSEGRLLDWARAHDAPSFIVPPSRPDRLSMLSRTARIASIIGRTGASIVHAIDPTCYREASWAALVTGARRVCHIQFPTEPSALRWLFRTRPHVIVTCYRGHVTELQSEWPAEIITAVPNAVRVDAFNPASQAVASQWKFGRGKMVIIVGHLSDIKGYPTFVRAAGLVRQHDPDCAFVALGGETIQVGFQAELEKLAREVGVAGDLHFLGWRQNVSEILRAADAFVLPSLKEGLPLSLLEAMACGVPSIATPVNGTAEVIRDEVNGLFVPVGDEASLARSIIRLLSDSALARRLSIEGRRTVETEFSMTALVARIQSIYDDVSAGRPLTRDRRADTQERLENAVCSAK